MIFDEEILKGKWLWSPNSLLSFFLDDIGGDEIDIKYLGIEVLSPYLRPEKAKNDPNLIRKIFHHIAAIPNLLNCSKLLYEVKDSLPEDKKIAAEKLLDGLNKRINVELVYE